MIPDTFWQKIAHSRGYKHLYQAKWDGYHTILALLLAVVAAELFAVLVLMAVIVARM